MVELEMVYGVPPLLKRCKINGKIISLNTSKNSRDITTTLYSIKCSNNTKENVKRNEFYIQKNDDDDVIRSVI